MLFSAVSLGSTFACGIDAGTQQPFCWGFGSSGQVGNGLTGSSNRVATPTTVIGVPPGAGTVGSGSTANESCWSATGGLSFCWGDGTYGQLGIGLMGVGMTMASAQSS